MQNAAKNTVRIISSREPSLISGNSLAQDPLHENLNAYLKSDCLHVVDPLASESYRFNIGESTVCKIATSPYLVAVGADNRIILFDRLQREFTQENFPATEEDPLLVADELAVAASGERILVYDLKRGHFDLHEACSGENISTVAMSQRLVAVAFPSCFVVYDSHRGEFREEYLGRSVHRPQLYVGSRVAAVWRGRQLVVYDSLRGVQEASGLLADQAFVRFEWRDNLLFAVGEKHTVAYNWESGEFQVA